MKNKIFEVFNKNKEKSKNTNIGYIVGGFPSLDFTREFLKKVDDSNIDILELGIPYSDPVADGNTISKAAFEACQNNVTTDTIFELLEDTKIKTPIVFLVYYNLIFSYGIDKFIKKSVKSNISGFIIPDLPYEEAEEIVEKLNSVSINFIPLVSVTSEDRIPKLVKQGSGFIYAIGSLGVTGTKPVELDRLDSFVKEIKKHTDTPVSLGFGIKTNEDVKKLRNYADGTIIGTSIVKLTESNDVDYTISKINELFLD